MTTLDLPVPRTYFHDDSSASRLADVLLAAWGPSDSPQVEVRGTLVHWTTPTGEVVVFRPYSAGGGWSVEAPGERKPGEYYDDGEFVRDADELCAALARRAPTPEALAAHCRERLAAGRAWALEQLSRRGRVERGSLSVAVATTLVRDGLVREERHYLFAA